MTRRLLGMTAALLLAVSLIGPVAADEDSDDSHYPTDWVELGMESAEGSFGGGGHAGTLGNALGADLRNGDIRMLDAETLEFRIRLWSLPASGGTPEAIRYTWDFDVRDEDGRLQPAQLDGKWSNYSRGACDPTSGQCNPAAGAMPRDPGLQPFLFRANQTQGCLGVELDEGACTGMNLTAYDELAVLQGDFDPDEATITIAVPLALFNEIEGVDFGHCSELRPRGGLFGAMIEAMPAAFISSNAFPADLVHPKLASQGGGIYTVPAPEGFADCQEYLESLEQEPLEEA